MSEWTGKPAITGNMPEVYICKIKALIAKTN